MNNGNQNGNNNKTNLRWARAVRRLNVNIDFNELFSAYLSCRKNKRRSKNSIEFELNLEENLYNLYDDLCNNTYEIGQFIYFILTKPKIREVWASNFRDRIIHHFIYNRMYPYYKNIFINDTYACIPNKGTSGAFNKLIKYVRSESEDYTHDTYVLKMDIKNFFINIDRNILWDLIKYDVFIQDINKLIYKVIFHDPKNNYKFNGNQKLINYVPTHKRLFNANTNCGLPIGNLTSQFFANIYLNELDKYCKTELNIKYYIRYMDDIIIVSKNKKLLKSYTPYIKNFVKTNLNLQFHINKTNIQNINSGVDFVGKILFPFHINIRKSTLKSLYSVLIENKIESINSYFGMLRSVNSHNIRKNIALNGIFVFDKEYTKILC